MNINIMTIDNDLAGAVSSNYEPKGASEAESFRSFADIILPDSRRSYSYSTDNIVHSGDSESNHLNEKSEMAVEGKQILPAFQKESATQKRQETTVEGTVDKGVCDEILYSACVTVSDSIELTGKPVKLLLESDKNTGATLGKLSGQQKSVALKHGLIQHVSAKTSVVSNTQLANVTFKNPSLGDNLQNTMKSEVAVKTLEDKPAAQQQLGDQGNSHKIVTGAMKNDWILVAADKKAEISNKPVMLPQNQSSAPAQGLLLEHKECSGAGQQQATVPANFPGADVKQLSSHGVVDADLPAVGYIQNKGGVENGPQQVLIRELDTNQQPFGVDGKGRTNPEGGGVKSDVFEKVFGSSNPTVSLPDRLPMVNEFIEKTQTAFAREAQTSIGEQILESVKSSWQHGNRQITIQLNPPELGKVIVQFEEQQGRIRGLLEVSEAQTRQEIEQVLPQIIKGLQESGVQIKRLDVQLADQSPHGSVGEQLQQDGRSFSEFREGNLEGQDFAGQGSLQDKTFGHWLSGDDRLSEGNVQLHVGGMNSSINILL